MIKLFRKEMLYISPERKHVLFWHGNIEALRPWPGLCAILGQVGDNDDVRELYSAVCYHYNNRKREFGNNKGFEKGDVVELDGCKTGIELYRDATKSN